MKKYTTIQMKAEVHELLKEYCKDNRRSLSGYVEYLILKNIQKDKDKDIDTGYPILRVTSKDKRY